MLLRAGLGLFAVALLLQLLPYGRDHTNPAVTQDAPWPDGRDQLNFSTWDEDDGEAGGEPCFMRSVSGSSGTQFNRAA